MDDLAIEVALRDATQEEESSREHQDHHKCDPHNSQRLWKL
jgi:hypothetical protein